MHDLLIKGGTIIDGSGAPRKEGDVAITDGKISAVGENVGDAKRTIDAKGCIVTPGFVDIHTHYDAQATWDPHLSPSSWHGVTSVVMGNCGVGFAPAQPERHDWLIGLMEGVEDIPGSALAEGIQWGWESFSEYMDVLDKQPRAVDVATQVPHGALRAYVMGDRGAKNEGATADDIAAMATIVQEGLRAGALGFSTSRTLIHKGIDGEYVPGTFAEEDELFGIARAMGEIDKGVFQMTSNHIDMPKEALWMRRLVEETGRPVSFNLLQIDDAPNLWRDMLAILDDAGDLPLYGQVAGRPAGILMTWAGTAHPFLTHPTYMQLHHLPVNERLVELRKPEVRAKICGEDALDFGEFENFILRSFHKMYRLGDQPEYEPDPSECAERLAESDARTKKEIVYDWLMADEGKGVVYFPIFNYSNEDIDHMIPLLKHPKTVLGLGDGGAHCGVICDASLPTFMLTHWSRDRDRGDRLSLEHVVQTQTRDTAHMYGLRDRGLLAPGYKGDVNVIDYDNLTLHAPKMVYDLPAGGRRLVQQATGYRQTIVSGEIIVEGGQTTDARPGALIRGAQSV